MVYWAVIADLVSSRSLRDRRHVQETLASLLAEANTRHRPALAARWTITLVDEFQALFRSPEAIPFAVEDVCNGLRPIGVRFGIGCGELSTTLKPDAVGMDGPCFHYAREALETARSARKLVVVRPLTPDTERVGDIWHLVLSVVEARTATQASAVASYHRALRQVDAANRLHITQGTLSVALRRAHLADIEPVLDHLVNMLGELAALP